MKHVPSLLSLIAASPAFAAGSVMSGVNGMAFSLLLILGLFVLAAWLAKRYLPQVGKSGAVKVIGATAVGAREKVVVVEIGDTWLVLGVGGGQVRTLHTLPRPGEGGIKP
ncbi:MAG: flagellar biosynthetic protein FliO [Hydrogenophilaceae bacterium]|nr:flagellar biosynthetic protein FliO [Hydrogenophilaceae bacterium]